MCDRLVCIVGDHHSVNRIKSLVGCVITLAMYRTEGIRSYCLYYLLFFSGGFSKNKKILIFDDFRKNYLKQQTTEAF